MNLSGIKPKNLVQQREKIFRQQMKRKKSYQICMEDQDIQ